MNARKADIFEKALKAIQSSKGEAFESIIEKSMMESMTDDIKNPSAFDDYEIELVAEYSADDGSNYCEPLNGMPIDEAKALPGFVKSFWTLYGHMKDGGVLAIQDYDTRDEAEKMLGMIGGRE